MPSTDCPIRCVVLAPAGDDGGTDQALRSLLEHRQWLVHQASHPLEAFAELCLLERIQASRAAWGLRRSERLALVSVEPSRWPRLDALLAAAGRYLPAVSLWRYSDGRLAPVSPASPQAEPGDRPDSMRVEAPPPPREPRPPGEPPEPPEPPELPALAEPPDSTEAAPHVSRDEIAMLLDSDERDHPT